MESGRLLEFGVQLVKANLAGHEFGERCPKHLGALAVGLEQLPGTRCRQPGPMDQAVQRYAQPLQVRHERFGRIVTQIADQAQGRLVPGAHADHGMASRTAQGAHVGAAVPEHDVVDDDVGDRRALDGFRRPVHGLFRVVGETVRGHSGVAEQADADLS